MPRTSSARVFAIERAPGGADEAAGRSSPARGGAGGPSTGPDDDSVPTSVDHIAYSVGAVGATPVQRTISGSSGSFRISDVPGAYAGPRADVPLRTD